jgi:gamma-glutamyltranspeptidase/glutathione hydrolase
VRLSPIRVLIALLVLSTGCARRESTGVSPMPGTAPTWAYLGKARITNAANAMVVSGSPIASEVGRDILQQGGNAVDAAVAVGLALAVVHPEAGNLGGGGFMIIRPHDGSVYALDYRETAPAAASRDMYRGAGEEASVTGHLSAGVPGAVAGLTEAHRRFGRLSFGTVIGPAIRLANEGFVMDEYRSSSIGEDSARLVLFPASRATFLPNGRPPIPGTIFNQPELGATLEAIRDSGPAGFYRGRVADLIVAEMKRGGGIITLQDLARSDRDHLSRLYHLLDATRLVRRCNDG